MAKYAVCLNAWGVIRYAENRGIHLRDPFILTVPEKQRYFLFGTGWELPGGPGFMIYESPDLKLWRGPSMAFRRIGTTGRRKSTATRTDTTCLARPKERMPAYVAYIAPRNA